MKKAFCVLCALLLAAGCGRPAPAEFAPLRAFASDFTLRHGEYEITGGVECLAYNELRFTFTHPAALSFLTLTATETGFAADVAGVPDTLDYGELPAGAALKIFALALRQAVFTQQVFTREENGYITRITAAGAPAVCRFGEDGLPKEIVCGDTTVWFL